MSQIDIEILDAFTAARASILRDEMSAAPASESVAALLVMAAELKGAKEQLGRIADVLGAAETGSEKIAQSDVPDNMLALLTALKATQS